MRLDVDLEGTLLPPPVLHGISTSPHQWELCYRFVEAADSGHDDETCLSLLRSTGLPLLSLARSRNHTIEAFIREKSWGGVAGETSTSTRFAATSARFSVSDRRGFCGPSQSGADMVANLQSNEGNEDDDFDGQPQRQRQRQETVWSILPPLPDAARLLLRRVGAKSESPLVAPSGGIQGELLLPQDLWEQHRNQGFSTHQVS